MKKFYIFLDVDGVLNNYKWLKFVHNKKLEDKGLSKYICPLNVENLNTILKILRIHQFNPVIVVSSSWRKTKMEELVSLLKQNKLNYTDKYYQTDFGFGLNKEDIRGLEIKDFIHFNQIKNNFVIIDDEMSSIAPHFPKEHLLKTSGLFKKGLSSDDVQDFFKTKFSEILKNIRTNEKSI